MAGSLIREKHNHQTT